MMNNISSFNKKLQRALQRTPRIERGSLLIDVNQLKLVSIGSEIILATLVMTELTLLFYLYNVSSALFFAAIVLLVSIVFIPSLAIENNRNKENNKPLYLMMVCILFLIVHTSLLMGLFVEKQTINNFKTAIEKNKKNLIESDQVKSLLKSIELIQYKIDSIDTGNNQETNEIKVIIESLKKERSLLLDTINNDLNDFWSEKTKGFTNSKICSRTNFKPFLYNGSPLKTLTAIVKKKYNSLKSNHPLNNDLKAVDEKISEKNKILSTGMIKKGLQKELNRKEQILQNTLSPKRSENLIPHLSVGIYKLVLPDEIYKGKPIFIRVTLVNIVFLAVLFFSYYLMVVKKNELQKKHNLFFKGPLSTIGGVFLGIVNSLTELTNDILKNIPLIISLIGTPFKTSQVLFLFWEKKIKAFNEHDKTQCTANKCLECGKPIDNTLKYCSTDCRTKYNNKKRTNSR